MKKEQFFLHGHKSKACKYKYTKSSSLTKCVTTAPTNGVILWTLLLKETPLLFFRRPFLEQRGSAFYRVVPDSSLWYCTFMYTKFRPLGKLFLFFFLKPYHCLVQTLVLLWSLISLRGNHWTFILKRISSSQFTEHQAQSQFYSFNFKGLSTLTFMLERLNTAWNMMYRLVCNRISHKSGTVKTITVIHFRNSTVS